MLHIVFGIEIAICCFVESRTDVQGGIRASWVRFPRRTKVEGVVNSVHSIVGFASTTTL